MRSLVLALAVVVAVHGGSLQRHTRHSRHTATAVTTLDLWRRGRAFQPFFVPGGVQPLASNSLTGTGTHHPRRRLTASLSRPALCCSQIFVSSSPHLLFFPRPLHARTVVASISHSSAGINTAHLPSATCRLQLFLSQPPAAFSDILPSV